MTIARSRQHCVSCGAPYSSQRHRDACIDGADFATLTTMRDTPGAADRCTRQHPHAGRHIGWSRAGENKRDGSRRPLHNKLSCFYEIGNSPAGFFREAG